MQVGIDSYSYHRRYGETGRRGAVEPRAVAAGAGPVLEHARRPGLPTVFLETCYLPEPEAIDAATLADAGPDLDVRFSWGHPWPSGRFHGLDGGRSPGAEIELARWIETAARLGHDVLRITAPAARRPAVTSPRRSSSPGSSRRPVAPPTERRGRRGRLATREPRRPAGRRHRSGSSNGSTVPRRRSASASTTSTSSGSATTWPRDPGPRAVHPAGPAQGPPGG